MKALTKAVKKKMDKELELSKTQEFKFGVFNFSVVTGGTTAIWCVIYRMDGTNHSIIKFARNKPHAKRLAAALNRALDSEQ